MITLSPAVRILIAYSVPTKNILQAEDSLDDDNSFLGYIFFVYVVPIVGLIAGVTVAVFVIRLAVRGWKKG